MKAALKVTTSDSFWAIRRVWHRYFDVFRKNILYGTVTTLVEPLLYLLSFGLGLGALVGEVEAQGVRTPYRAFIFAGIVAQTVLFQGFFEASYGGFIRMYYQKIFQAMATTPITLSEVLWGELLWDASKGTFASAAVLLIGVVAGDFSTPGALLAVPLCFVGSFMFAAMGLWVAAISRTIEVISYPQYLLVFPMFLFCGIFYPIETLPGALQWLCWALPLTPVVALARSLVLESRFPWHAAPLLPFWTLFFTWLSRRSMFRRLVK